MNSPCSAGKAITKLAIALCPAILLAQGAPSFDVATVKPSTALQNGVVSGSSNTANGLRIAGTLRMFVKYAYDLEDPQLSGGPAWLDRDIYAINARANRRVAAGELKQMLQSLLTDRFRLTVHRETRELPVYLLVLAKSGSKLDRGDENLRAVSSGPTLLRGTMDSARIARQLTLMLHRTVIDKTGLQGVWKFDLTWAPDDVTTGPSLFTAIQEQLGLKLESGKGPVQVLVIDRAEKPSDN